MKKWIACLLAILLTLSLGCAGAESSDAPNHLAVASPTALSGNFFTAAFGSNTSDMDVRNLIHGYNLVRWNVESGRFEIDSSVVSGIKASDDIHGNRTYVISLCDDLLYSDGTPIGAADYVFSLLLAASPEIQELGAAVAGNGAVVGIDEYKSGATRQVSGVRLMGEKEFSITVKANSLPNFYELAELSYYPYPIHVIAPGCQIKDDGKGAYIANQDAAQDSAIFTAETLKRTLLDESDGYLSHPSVVSGPYTLVSFDGSVAELSINPCYKGDADGRKGKIQNITVSHVSNEEMAAKLESGEINLTNKIVSAQAIAEGHQLEADGKAQTVSYGREGMSFISFCCEQTAVSSRNVRQALSYALDKDAVVSAYVGENGRRVDGYYGAGQWMYRVAMGEVALPADAKSVNTLSDVKVYNLDLDAAKALLVSDGWILNASGAEFVEGQDTVRCKNVDGQIVALELKMIYPEGNAVGDALQTAFADNLAKIGVSLQLEAKPMQELLRLYYRQDARECHMIYLATNFETVYDPAQAFAPETAEQGANRTGIQDETLYKLAVELRKTEPGDVAGYVNKWVSFQQAFQEAVPMIPIYSNTYYDFYSPNLQGYDIAENTSWAYAILDAVLTDAQ